MAEASGDARMVRAGAPSETCRINALPSNVLARAISFLDARQLVRTCVLSLQWRDLWRSMPRINASRDEFDGMPGTWVEQNVLFRKFFNRFLMLRNPTPLDEFNLWYGVRDSEDSTDRDYVAESEDANLWIGHALQCNARSVKVSAAECGAKLHLDPVMFASKCFLTSLELTRVVLFAGFFKNLQMGCTLLERLKLYDCPICDAEVFSQTLRLFTIDPGCLPHSKQTSISIPSLVDFSYFSGERIPPLLKNLGSLETATVSIGTYDDDTPLSDIHQFLRGLSNVTHLDLSYKGPKVRLLT